MTKNSHLLGAFEEMVMLAVVRLSPQAYGMTVRREISERSGREIAIGAVYATLERLEKKDYLESRSVAPEPSQSGRRGRARRFFALRPAGATALLNTRKLRLASWEGIESKTVLEAVRP